MTAKGELYIGEDCRDAFEKDLDEWFGKDKWKINGSDFSDCWDMEQFPEVAVVDVVDYNRNKIGKVEITSHFYVEDDGYGRSVGCEPKSIKLLETNDKLKQIFIERENLKNEQKL